jgi:hypothetical protein
MKNHLLLAIAIACAAVLSAQRPAPPPAPRTSSFTTQADGSGYRFTPVMPALMQKAGAPPAYYTYFWEFGDGSFSRAESPTHIFANGGPVVASLDATAHYDDGEKPKGYALAMTVQGASNPSPLLDVFDAKTQQAIALAANSAPRANEPLTCILSYRNNSLVTTDGRLHLFFNERKFDSPHFRFDTARVHFGEYRDAAYSQTLPTATPPTEGWVLLPVRTFGGVSTSLSGDWPNSTILQEMLKNARDTYRAEQALHFGTLKPGEKRNIFIGLPATPTMLSDTNALIHVEAIFAPFDPAVPPESFVLEMKIVSSHDPNAIAVSDNRVNYRSIGNKKLNYKVEFQNNGQGPASTVEVKVETPNGLKMERMRPLKWYPECPICPDTPTVRSCLDTAFSKEGLVFTFRNIYLPGSRQEDVDDRDSTKGFVKYRIEANRNMPKRPFRSRAKIVFDKNPPIYTNYTRTRFKIGVSPGLKVGYAFEPNLDATSGESFVQNGYFLLGASLSPYKSWRAYPQVELLTGIKGRTALPETLAATVDTMLNDNPEIMLPDSTITNVLSSGDRGFVSFEVPVLLRKNFSRAFGLGLGASARVTLENGENRTETSVTTIQRMLDTSQGMFQIVRTVSTGETQTNVTTYRDTRWNYTAFGDLTLGSVRAGLNLGLRAGFMFEEGRKPTPFAQVSAEMKL